MKIKIIKSFDIEVLGFNYNMTYEEAKELYVELHKEFGYNAEKFWEDRFPYNIQQVPNDVSNGRYTSNETPWKLYNTEPGVSNEYTEFLRKNRS